MSFCAAFICLRHSGTGLSLSTINGRFLYGKSDKNTPLNIRTYAVGVNNWIQ